MVFFLFSLTIFIFCCYVSGLIVHIFVSLSSVSIFRQFPTSGQYRGVAPDDRSDPRGALEEFARAVFAQLERRGKSAARSLVFLWSFFILDLFFVCLSILSVFFLVRFFLCLFRFFALFSCNVVLFIFSIVFMVSSISVFLFSYSLISLDLFISDSSLFL